MGDSKSDEEKTVLVIGGGMGGIAAINGLRKFDKKVKIVLVEPKEYLEVLWASYRSPFVEWVANGSVLSLKGFCEKNDVTHIRGVVTKLTKHEATLSKPYNETGDTILPFDVCCIATGAKTHWPAMGRGVPQNDDASTRDHRLKTLKEEGDKLLEAKSVLVVGGGLVGTELAGDIAAYAKERKKDVKVTLVHSGERLCHLEFNEKASLWAKQNLESLGVTVILNDKAIESAETNKMVLEKGGKELDAEQVVLTVGLVPINGFLKEGGLDGCLTESGWVDTDDCLLVKNVDTNNLFSIGDSCVTLPNSGSQILGQISIIGHNLKATLDGKTATDLKKVAVQPEVYLATTGPRGGVFHLKGGMTTQYFLPTLKNWTMFLFRATGELGLK